MLSQVDIDRIVDALVVRLAPLLAHGVDAVPGVVPEAGSFEARKRDALKWREDRDSKRGVVRVQNRARF